jgi:hypothetical protein
MKNTKSGSPSFCFVAANLLETRRTTRLLCCVFGNRSLGTCFQVLGNIVSCDRHSSVMPRAHATHGYEVQAGLGTLLRSPEFDRHGLGSLLRFSEARHGFNSLQTICNVACAVATPFQSMKHARQSMLRSPQPQQWCAGTGLVDNLKPISTT